MTAKSSLPEPVMNVAEIEAFIDEVFPQLHHGGRSIVIESVGTMTAQLRLAAHDRHLRPGGTISGPAMFTLADVGLYVVILAHIGREALAVTTNLNINFLRRPPQGDVIVQCRLLKLGKRLAVGEATLFSPGARDSLAQPVGQPVAHAVGTYSIPARRGAVL
jgi:uncharacterized protein (TIGR00369 family)